MKRRFRWWISALLLYLLSVPIILLSIGLTLYLIVAVYISVSGLTGSDAAGLPYMAILILFFGAFLYHYFLPFLSQHWSLGGFVREGSGD